MSAKQVTTFNAENGEIKQRAWRGTFHECSHREDVACYEEEFVSDPLSIALGIMQDDLLPFLEQARGGEIRITFEVERGERGRA